MKINNNVLSFILSFVDLKQTSEIIKELTDKNKNLVIGGLSVNRGKKFKVINGAINNYQRRCGECNNSLENNWAIIIGNKDCGECLSDKNLNLEICNKCCQNRFNKKIKRGNVETLYCEGCKMIVLHIGVNMFS